MNFFTDIDLKLNQLKNVVLDKYTTLPTTNTAGQIVYDAEAATIKYNTGSGWKTFLDANTSLFNGSYNSLSDRPILNTSNTTTLDANASETLTGTINLHKVAKTGSYTDLLNKPAINNATLTITRNNTSVGTFTANASADKTINIDVPAQVQSDWDATTGLGVILNKPSLATVATSGNYTDLINRYIISTSVDNLVSIVQGVPENTTQIASQILTKAYADGVYVRKVNGNSPDANGNVSIVIPSVENGTLTLKAGSNQTTFSANQSTNTTFEITAADLGLSNAVKFIGITTTNLTDNSSTSTITLTSGDTKTLTTNDAGAVVLYKDGSNNIEKEFIWTGSTWELLGQETAWDPKGTAQSLIDTLDASITGTPSSSKTVTSFSQTDGKVSATFGDISISKSQITDFPTIGDGTLTFTTGATPTTGSFNANSTSNTTITTFSGRYTDLSNKPSIKELKFTIASNTTEYRINHGLNTKKLLVQIYDPDYHLCMMDVHCLTNDIINITRSTPTAAEIGSQFHVHILAL